MFLKLIVDQKPAIIYRLSKNEIFIGSSPASTLSIQYPSVSKNHLKMIIQDESCWVCDLGSTNGSYIRDEKLIPGNKAKIDFDDSVRLGDKVYLTLLKTATEAVELPDKAQTIQNPSRNLDPDKTQIVSLSDLQQAKILAEKKRKKDLHEKKVEELKRKKAETRGTSRVILICTLILMIGWISNKVWKARNKKIHKETIINRMKTKFSGDLEIEADIEGLRISRKALISRRDLSKGLVLPKCNQLETKNICQDKKIYSFRDNGVIFKSPDVYSFFVEEKNWLSLTNALINSEDRPKEISRRKFAFLNFFKDYISDQEIAPEAEIYFIIYNYDANNVIGISNVAAMSSRSIDHLAQMLEDEKFPGPFDKIETVVAKFEKYYTFY
jgi:pSer/pThr/pTyr-binding forkhead associated (FHA) protein